MKVSIVVPVYNSGKYIERCLDSILDSLGKTDGEILAIDNNSTDNSVKILKQYLAKHRAHPPRAIMVPNKPRAIISGSLIPTTRLTKKRFVNYSNVPRKTRQILSC